ncbi:hypothetical protein Vretimale_12485 [Volvox reticuliferus]|uniref:Uncharacterized protein n=1 Tax=Volvox reticuliferus TaxID=1737510 RepID=A0A8J4GII6_9CHLO|nr:hypothetical protein Vretimale_12485 [Volvox reticuliferus]
MEGRITTDQEPHGGRQDGHVALSSVDQDANGRSDMVHPQWAGADGRATRMLISEPHLAQSLSIFSRTSVRCLLVRHEDLWSIQAGSRVRVRVRTQRSRYGS